MFAPGLRSTRSIRIAAQEKRNALHISVIRFGARCATRLPKCGCDTVTALCRFTAQGALMPSSSSNLTSKGTPRTVDVIGATAAVDR